MLAGDGCGMSAVLKVDRVGRVFTGGPKPLVAVDDVSFELAAGETLGIVGESGCGKSTLARMVLKLLPATSGRIEIAGTDVTDLPEAQMRPLRRRIQAVFQDPVSSLNPRMRVRDIVAEPLHATAMDSAQRAARVQEMLAVVGMPNDAAERYPHAFSGGQRQRIAIARALSASPQILICDEATSALDVSVQAQVLNLLGVLRKRFQLSMLFISHNLGAVRHVSDRVAVMYLGRIVELGSEDQIFERPAHPYTQALIASVPEATVDATVATPLAGEIPSPRNRPSGCHFHPRCPKAQARCGSEDPALTKRIDGHAVRCHFPN
jgi:oligopeptide/dipeptide ABC transporter ATP-binding protein